MHALTTVSTSITTGTTVTAGGLAVKLQAYTGGIVAVLGTGQSTSPQTGTMVVAGGMGVAEDLYVVGGVLVTFKILISSTTQSQATQRLSTQQTTSENE